MLRRLSAALAVVAVTLLVPSPVFAWSWAGHRLIMQRAIDLLPPEIKPFFIEHREEIVYRAIDPDLWRDAGWDEEQNHFINFGVAEYGPYPFSALPRDHTAALEKFGAAAVKRNGTLLWRAPEMAGNLRGALAGFAQANGLSPQFTVFFSGVASHYLQDATQPFHAAANYDGQLTDQRGVHGRFEEQLLSRFSTRLTLTPAAPKTIPNVQDYAFELALASFRDVDAILKADKESIGAKDTYGDEYFEAFFAKTKPILEERLSTAVTATASLIITAWEEAGRPALTLPPRRPAKVQRAPR